MRKIAFLALSGAALLGTACGPSSSSTGADTGGGGATMTTTEPGTGGSGAATADGGAGGSGGATGAGGAPDARPDKPADLVSYVTGNDEDKDVTPAGPGLILMGGGTDVDEAFHWWKPLIAGGDVVVLRASGADGYNSYLYQDIGGCDSVETLLVTTPALAAAPYVAWTVAHAEAVFMAGGDQAKYLTAWKDTPLEEAIMAAYNRGAVIGGTSAGCAVMGQYMFAAYEDTVYSDEALGDPYNMYMTLDDDFLSIPLLAGWITDTHFAERDRMGRLVGFLARVVQDGWAPAAVGVGIDEQTAIVVGPDGAGQVLGSNAAYMVRTTGAPEVCAAGQSLEYSNLVYARLAPGDKVQLPGAKTSVPEKPLSASGGALTPANPY